MLKDYIIAIDNGWQVELVKSVNDVRQNPVCYLTFHGSICGEISTKDCLFKTIVDDVPQDVRAKAIRAVAAHREKIEAAWQHNKEIIFG